MKTYTCTQCESKVCVVAESKKNSTPPTGCPFSMKCFWVEVVKKGS